MNEKERERVFRDWLARYQGVLVHVARGFVEPQDRDDLLQEMMLALWHAVPAFRRQIATEVLEEPISVAVSNG